MTEEEWQTTESLSSLFRWVTCSGLTGTTAGATEDPERWHDGPSNRKLRLFAAAAWRNRMARHKGDVGDCDFQVARLAEGWADSGVEPLDLPLTPVVGSRFVPLSVDAYRAADGMINSLLPDEKLPQLLLFRDVVGNPFRPVTLPPCGRCGGDGAAHGSDRPLEWAGPGTYPGHCPECLGRRSPVVTAVAVSLAQDAYDVRDWYSGHLDPLTLVAVADALEEAGCQDEQCPACLDCPRGPMASAIATRQELLTRRHPAPWWPCRACGGSGRLGVLDHLRSPGFHVRGCWALDLVLGKE